MLVDTRLPGSARQEEWVVIRGASICALSTFVLEAVTASACLRAPAPASALGIVSGDVEGARRSLAEFLGDLNRGRFDLAATAYSGPLDSLRRLSPSVPPNSIPSLLQAACQSESLQCLPLRSETLRAAPYPTEWIFAVEFTSPGGGVFRTRSIWGPLGPRWPFQSQFRFRVVRANGGRYAVLDLPPADP